MVAPLIAAAGSLLPSLFGLVDDLIDTDEERAEAKRKLIELEQKGQLAQIAVNAQEAQHESLFVAGWRPAIGWICGFGLAWIVILRDLLVIGLTMFAPGIDPAVLPDPDTALLMTILGGLLGLGGLRTYEKRTSVNMNRGAVKAAQKAAKAARSAFDRGR